MHGLTGGSWKRSRHRATATEKNNPTGNRAVTNGSVPYRRSTPPRQLSTGMRRHSVLIHGSACPARENRACDGPNTPQQEGTSKVKRSQWRPWLSVIAGGESLISSSGGGVVGPDRSGLWPAPEIVSGFAQVAAAAVGARPGQDPAGPRDHDRLGWGLRRRHRGPARPTRDVRTGGVRPDRVPHDRPAGAGW